MLIIRGIETDTLVTKAWQLLQEVQSDALFLEVLEAGHLAPIERPGQIADEIECFMGNLNRVG